LKFPIKRTISLLISVLLVYLIFHKIDLNQTLNTLKEFNLKCLLLIVPIYFSGFIVRAFRWKTLLLERPFLCVKNLLGIIFVGNFINSFMPARAGDFYRAHLLGKDQDIKRVEVLASVVLERVIDGFIVFFFLLFTVLCFYSQPWLFKVVTTVGIIFLGSFVALFSFSRYVDPDKFCQQLENLALKLPTKLQNPVIKFINFFKTHTISFINGLDIFKHPSLLLKSMGYTTVIWLIEGLISWVIIKNFGISISFLAAIFVMCLLVFSSLIPSTSVFVGPYQYAYIVALGIFGVTKEKALAIALANQIVIMLPTVTAGLFYLLKYHINIKNIKTEISEENSELEPAS